MTEAIGWTASLILLATLVRQIVKQARSDDVEGVSTWLFVGQALASALFVVYSVLLDNRVFVVTNSCLLLTALVGQAITLHKRHSARRTESRPGNARAMRRGPTPTPAVAANTRGER